MVDLAYRGATPMSFRSVPLPSLLRLAPPLRRFECYRDAYL